MPPFYGYSLFIVSSHLQGLLAPAIPAGKLLKLQEKDKGHEAGTMQIH